MTEWTLGGRRLRAALRQLAEEGETQQAIANRLGCSQSAITQWVNGHVCPKQDKIDRFKESFDVRDEFFTDPALGDAPDYRKFVGRAETRVEREDEAHPVVEAFIAEMRMDQTEADDLRRQVRAWDGRFVRDELLMLLPAIRMRAARLRAEAAGEPDPAPKEPPPVPEGRRRVPPGKRGR